MQARFLRRNLAMYASVSLEWEIAAMQTLSAKRPRRLNSVCLSLEAWRALCAATESSDKGKTKTIQNQEICLEKTNIKDQRTTKSEKLIETTKSTRISEKRSDKRKGSYKWSLDSDTIPHARHEYRQDCTLAKVESQG